MGRACSMNGKKRDECRILVGTPEEKRPRRGWWIIVKWILEK
jgi:hypothetical protein